MVEKNASSLEQQKTSLAEKLWLAYMNSYLYENGMITETQRNRMAMKIENHKGSTCRTRERER